MGVMFISRNHGFVNHIRCPQQPVGMLQKRLSVCINDGLQPLLQGRTCLERSGVSLRHISCQIIRLLFIIPYVYHWYHYCIIIYHNILYIVYVYQLYPILSYRIFYIIPYQIIYAHVHSVVCTYLGVYIIQIQCYKLKVCTYLKHLKTIYTIHVL